MAHMFGRLFYWHGQESDLEGVIEINLDGAFTLYKLKDVQEAFESALPYDGLFVTHKVFADGSRVVKAEYPVDGRPYTFLSSLEVWIDGKLEEVLGLLRKKYSE